MALTPDYKELLDCYPAQVEELGGKVLGGSYFSGRRGFAFEPSTTATAIRGDAVRDGPLVESDPVVAGFYVVAAPDLDLARRIAQLNPATHDGGVR